MGLRGWLRRRFSKAPAVPADPVQAYDQRLQTLAGRAAELRRSAATLLAARGELDRSIEAAREQEQEARRRQEQAAGRADVLPVLVADAERAGQRQADLRHERERLEEAARELAETVAAVEAEADALRRERDSVATRWAASRSVAEATGKVLSESFHELTALDRARDEVERAHALADLAREDLARVKGRTGSKG